MTFAITIGEGRQRPQGRAAALTMPLVESLYELLKTQPARVERWWSVHLWERDYRVTKGWRASIGVAVDLDYRIRDSPPSPEVTARLADAARAGKLPGSIFHLTPHGARVVFVYEVPCNHREMQISASKGAAALVERALAELDLFDYVIDPCTWDLARFYYTPNSVAKGVARNADLVMMRSQPFEADALAAKEPPDAVDETPAPQLTRRVVSMDESIKEVIARWNADHRQTWPSKPSTCPACQHKDCFHALPDDNTKWVCFSTNHGDEVGRPTKEGKAFWGDALDLEAHARGVEPIDVLRDDCYLSPPKRSRAAARKVAVNDDSPDIDDEPIPLRQPVAEERWRSRSYLTAVKVLRQNAGDVLEGRKLELNEMTGVVELARTPLRDRDVSRIRSLIEERLSGGWDKKREEEIPLVVSREDLLNAADQVAAENGYHPVQEYLRAQEWDGVERLNAFAKDVLGAEDTPLNRALVRRWFISAIARAMRPGCKVDHVLILCGKQGVGKSTVFKNLAGEPWFSDSPVEVQDPHAALKLRQSWIVEWAELESLQRARDAEAVKAFLTSSTDVYLAKYEKLPQRMPRSCVIVGTTNQDEFLADPTGNRRFWPIRCGEHVDFELVEKIRDQLWAEALAAFNSGETWLLSASEATLLVAEHDRHRIRDAWEELILPWAESRTAPFLTSEVLEEALQKPAGQWSKADEMRVSRILKQTGWVKDWRRGSNKSEPRRWRRDE